MLSWHGPGFFIWRKLMARTKSAKSTAAAGDPVDYSYEVGELERRAIMKARNKIRGALAEELADIVGQIEVQLARVRKFCKKYDFNISKDQVEQRELGMSFSFDFEINDEKIDRVVKDKTLKDIIEKAE